MNRAVCRRNHLDPHRARFLRHGGCRGGVIRLVQFGAEFADRLPCAAQRAVFVGFQYRDSCDEVVALFRQRAGEIEKLARDEVAQPPINTKASAAVTSTAPTRPSRQRSSRRTSGESRKLNSPASTRARKKSCAKRSVAAAATTDARTISGPTRLLRSARFMSRPPSFSAYVFDRAEKTSTSAPPPMSAQPRIGGIGTVFVVSAVALIGPISSTVSREL